jgi:1-deoxyxylulose-5-phosphate synthase
MRFRHLGRTGLRVSEICLGTVTFGSQADQQTAHHILDTAADAGVQFFDTSNVYPMTAGHQGLSEEYLGSWLRASGRDRFVVATKVAGRTGPGWNERGLSRAHILRAVDDSLRRLQTDYIDLYQIHAPDPSTPVDETLRAFDDLVRWGKVRYIGCANHAGWQLALALGLGERHGWARLDSEQTLYNLLSREVEDEVLPLCRDQGVGFLAYSPLAGGFLTGKYRTIEETAAGGRFDAQRGPDTLYRRRYWTPAGFTAVERLHSHFATRDISLAQAAIAWVLAQPGITAAVIGASRPEQLQETLSAVEVHILPEDRALCDDIWLSLPRSRVSPFVVR